jgi:hypothetical protein
MAITKCLFGGRSVCGACQRLAITQPANGASTELRNDVGELSINIESTPRALNDSEIDSVAGGIIGLNIFLGSLIGTHIGQAVGGWCDDGPDTASSAIPRRP